jgi:chitinase
MRNTLISKTLVGALMLLTGAANAQSQLLPKLPLFGPYKHINMGLDPASNVVTGQFRGKTLPLAAAGKHILPRGISVLSLAFASGECGDEHWGSVRAQQLADANVQRLQQAGLPYIISTGGEGQVFACSTDAGFEKFVQRYASPALLGFDFDIESTQTEEGIRELVQRLPLAQKNYPTLRFSFTLATFASSDGGGASLNATGERVMKALQDFGVQGYVINLMVMNYGPGTAANCVVRQGRCDMAASAEQAVKNLQAKYQLPPSQIAITAMLGVNDVVSNVFTPEDARELARYARKQGLAGLHYWSLDRDRPCEKGATAVSPSCSSLNSAPADAFVRAFLHGLKP